MIKEYGIYRTSTFYVGNKLTALVEVELGFSTHERAEAKLLEPKEDNKDIKFKYKGVEYFVIPYYKNNE